MQRRGSELAPERYDEPHLKSLQYDIAINLICEQLSYPAISSAGREPTRGPRVHYCYSAALQNGGEYAENRILSSIIYGLRPRRHTVYSLGTRLHFTMTVNNMEINVNTCTCMY